MRPTSPTLSLSSAILFLLTLPSTQASITCTSPSSSTVNPGNTITLGWGDSGSYPRASDVYSTDATISCSSGSQITKLSSISNGQSWTVPGDVANMCQGGGLDVVLSGTYYDILHLTHWYGFEASCGSVQVAEPEPVAPTTTTTAQATTTSSTTTTDPVTASTTVAVTMASGSTVTPTITLTPNLSGTLPGVSPPTAPIAKPAATPSINNINSPNTPPSTISSSSSPSEPPSKLGGSSKAALGALGALAALAAIAIVIFGLVLFKRRQRRRAREERWMDHNYSSPSMSDHKGSGGGGSGYAFASGPGGGGTAGLSYLENQPSGHTSHHNPGGMASSTSASHHVKSAEHVIPQPALLADRNGGSVDDDSQREMSPIPTRPARTYQGDFDDATTPWDGELGYLHTYPHLQPTEGEENVDLGYEYIQDYIPITPHVHHRSLSTNNNNSTTNTSDNIDSRQLSMRASSQLPADLEYFSQLCEASWPMPPTTTITSSPTHHPQHQSTTMTTTPDQGLGLGL